jgi:hypothetical protein
MRQRTENEKNGLPEHRAETAFKRCIAHAHGARHLVEVFAPGRFRDTDFLWQPGTAPSQVAHPATRNAFPCERTQLARTQASRKEMTTAAMHNLQFDSAVVAEDAYWRPSANIGISPLVGVTVGGKYSIPCFGTTANQHDRFVFASVTPHLLTLIIIERT